MGDSDGLSMAMKGTAKYCKRVRCNVVLVRDLFSCFCRQWWFVLVTLSVLTPQKCSGRSFLQEIMHNLG